MFTFPAFRVLNRRAIAGTLEVHVPLPAFTACAKNEFFSVFREIRNLVASLFVLVSPKYKRPRRHLDDFRWRAAAVHLLPLSMAAGFRLHDRLVEKGREIIRVQVGTQNHVAAFATISAVRSATRDKLFPAKTHTTPPAVTGLRLNSNSIDKHDGVASRL